MDGDVRGQQGPQQGPGGGGGDTDPSPVLVFDGGCPFCRHFAELSELRSGIPGLQIRDGREDAELRQTLARRGFHLRDGAMVIHGEEIHHGAAAIQWLCARMTPSAALLQVLAPLMGDGKRARTLYPLLLVARRLALGARGLPVDPEEALLQPSRQPQLR
jgi:hypothetical protein